MKFFKKWAKPGLFLFIFILFKWQIYHKYYIWKKCRWCAWDSNLGRQDGRRRQIHWAMAAPQMRWSWRQLTTTFENETVKWKLQNDAERQTGIGRDSERKNMRGVVKWSSCLPSSPTIRIQIPQEPRYCSSVKFVFEKNENKRKEAEVWPLLKRRMR